MSDFRDFLFMGQQADPEAFARARVYDATREPTEAEARLVADWRANYRPTPRPGGGVYPNGGPRCACGGCLFVKECP